MKFRHLQKSAHYKLNGCFKLVNFWWIFKMTWASQPVKNCDIFLYLCDFQEATRGSLRGGDFLDFSWGIMPQDYGVFWMVSVSNFAKQGFLVCILLRSTCATNRLVPIPLPFRKVSHVRQNVWRLRPGFVYHWQVSMNQRLWEACEWDYAIIITYNVTL